MSEPQHDPEKQKALIRRALNVLQNYTGEDGRLNATLLVDELERLQSELDQANAREEAELGKVIDERDQWEDRATELAEAVGRHLGVEVGEHSSGNCPVQSALDYLSEANARERKAFESGVRAVGSRLGIDDMMIEAAWQQYRSQDDSDWRAGDSEAAKDSAGPAPGQDYEGWPCDPCDIEFSDYAALQKHRAEQHGSEYVPPTEDEEIALILGMSHDQICAVLKARGEDPEEASELVRQIIAEAMRKHSATDQNND